MRRPLRILARARADVDQIFHWLERRSPAGAERWYKALVENAGKLLEAPESFPAVAESYRWPRNIREALFKTPRGRRYRIVFELTETEILILRIRGPGQPPLRRRDLPLG